MKNLMFLLLAALGRLLLQWCGLETAAVNEFWKGPAHSARATMALIKRWHGRQVLKTKRCQRQLLVKLASKDFAAPPEWRLMMK